MVALMRVAKELALLRLNKIRRKKKMVKQVSSKEFKEEKGVVLVDFYADWCGPCRMISPVLEDLSEEIQGVKFVKINVDQERDFSIANRVSSIPTIVLFKDGVELDRRIGFASKEGFKSWINGLI